MFYKDFEAWVDVNGKDLNESDSWLNKDPFGLKDGKNKILNCWVPSEEGKEFTIHVRAFDKSLNSDYEVQFYVDGVLADDDLLRKAENEGEGESSDNYAEAISEGVQVNETYLKHYVFRRSAALSGTPTYNSGSGSGLKLEPDFGLIRIEIRRVEVKGYCTDNAPWCPPNFLRLAESPLEKRTTDTFSHRVRLSEEAEKLKQSPERLDVKHLQGEDSSTIIFEFSYAPKNWLKTHGNVLKARNARTITSSPPRKVTDSAGSANKHIKYGRKRASVSCVEAEEPMQDAGPAPKLLEVEHRSPGAKERQSMTTVVAFGSTGLHRAHKPNKNGIQTPISRIRGQKSTHRAEQVKNVSARTARSIKPGTESFASMSAQRQTDPTMTIAELASARAHANSSPTPVASADPNSSRDSSANSTVPAMPSFERPATGRTPTNIHSQYRRGRFIAQRLSSGAAEHRETNMSSPSEAVTASRSARLLSVDRPMQGGTEMIRAHEPMADEIQEVRATSTHSMEDPELAQELPAPAPPDMYTTEPDQDSDPDPDPEPSAEPTMQTNLPVLIHAQVGSVPPEARPVAGLPDAHRHIHSNTESERTLEVSASALVKESGKEDDVLLPISDTEQLLRHRLQFFLNIEGIIQRAKCDIAADIESTDKMIAGMSFYSDEGGNLQKRQSDLLEELRSLEPRAGPSKKMRRN